MRRRQSKKTAKAFQPKSMYLVKETLEGGVFVEHGEWALTHHQAIVNDFFERVWEKGDIYLDRQQGWYCVACEEFKKKRLPKASNPE